MINRIFYILTGLLFVSTLMRAQTDDSFRVDDSIYYPKILSEEDSLYYVALSDTMGPSRSSSTGDDMQDPIVAGSYSTDFYYRNSQNTYFFTHKYGRSTRDVFHRFELTVSMNVTVTHEDSEITDTYMYLLDSNGTLIASNDDYGGEGHCSNTRHSFIRSQLPPGTYYIVSEGYREEGYITVYITGNTSGGFNYPSIPSTYSTEPGTAVGGMGATFSVSPMGGATFSIPIEMPQGVGGLQPQLSIVYNSQSGNGMCGYGANLAGLSVITRGPKDIYHDGQAQGMKYLADDALYLDGVRLILADGYTAGQEGAVYHPESDPFTSVITHVNTTTNRIWFELQGSDGVLCYYGNQDNSCLYYTETNEKKIYSWYFCHLRQPTGNYITYDYTNVNSNQDDNCVYPYVISYGKNWDHYDSFYNAIYFTYENRDDIIPLVIGGHKCWMTKRLETVTTQTGANRYRTYTLNYNTTGDGTAYKYSRLVSVTEKNSQNESLPATKLNWTYLPSIGYSCNSLSVEEPSNLGNGVTFPFNNQTLLSGDLNNDGLTDIIGIGTVAVPNANGGYDYKTYAYFYYASRTSSGEISYNSGQNFVLPPSFDYSIMEAHLKSLAIIDLDGDGTNELFVPYYTQAGAGNGTVYIYVVGQNYPIYQYWGYGLYGSTKPLFTTGDINNDGRSDIILMETTANNGQYPIRVLQYNPGFIYGNTNPDHGLFNTSVTTGLSLASTPKQIYLTDMNGNGLKDLFVICDNHYVVYWNQGCGISATSFSDSFKTTDVNVGYQWMTTAGDFNGDGLLDVLTNATGSSGWFFNINNGDGTFSRMQACTLGLYDQSFTSYDDSQFHCDVMDFDGDGRSDVVITKAMYTRQSDLFGEWGVFNKTYTYWMRSTGTTLDYVCHATSKRAADALSNKYITGDFDGDGHMELINYGYDCVNGEDSDTDPVWRIYNNSSLTAQSGKVTSVTGDFGATTSITYSTLADNTVYTRGVSDTYPAPRYTIPLNVVKQTVQNNGAAGSLTTRYSYEGLKIHLRGHGMLGYSKTTANCTTTGISIESGVSQWDTAHYIPKVTFSNTIIGSDYAQTINTLTVTDTYKANHKIYFAYPSQSVDTDMDGNSVTINRSYDNAHGYLNSETATYSATMYRSVVYSDYTQTSKGVYLPKTITTSQKHSDDNTPFSTTDTCTYDLTTGAVLIRVQNVGSSKPLTTQYTYDLFGNLTSQVSTGSGVAACTTYYTYDATNRFPVAIYTSPASSVTKYTYDVWGNVLTETDSISTTVHNKVTNTYDYWGNLVRTQLPDGKEITYTRGWNNNTSQRWYVLEQGTVRPWVKTWYDNQGREVKTVSVGAKDISVVNTTTFNNKGLAVARTSTEGNLSLSYSYTYDSRGRLTRETAPGNRTVNYQYGNRSVTATENGSRTTTKTFDAWGNLKTVTAPISGITNTYASSGGIKTSVSGGATWTFGYDDRGNRSSLSDPDAGTTTYTFDALGREIQRVDARGIVFGITYDYLGRVTSETAGNQTTTYTYGTSGTGKMRLTLVSDDVWVKGYSYDALGRIIQETIRDRYDYLSYKKRTNQYDSNSLLTGRTYSNDSYQDGSSISYSYDAYGNCTAINGGEGALVWSLTGNTGTTMTSSVTLDNTTPYVRTTQLDGYGNLQSRITTRGNSTLQNDSYAFSALTGNLTSRTLTGSQAQTFSYDNVDRLTGVFVGNNNQMTVSYAANGNISSKTDMGLYSYNSNSKPHAVDYILPPDNRPESEQYIEYNDWGKATDVFYYVGNDFYHLEMDYGPDRQHVSDRLLRNDTILYYRFCWDEYERMYWNGNQHTYYWIEAPDGLAGMFGLVYGQYNDGAIPFVAMTDHLGSLTALYNQYGNKTLGLAYDVWGRRTFTMNSMTQIKRGFTGHGHIDELGLINMGGRVYDPLQGRFLSPDNYIQLPDNPQNYNRYSYCLNNPLKYTDPDGESWLIAGIAAFLLLTEEGYNIQKAISPIALHLDVHLGTHQLGLGYDVSVGRPTIFPISYRNHYGETYYWKTYGGNSGWEYREGGEWGLQGSLLGVPYHINISGTKFTGINSQITNLVTLSMLPFRRTTYENDTQMYVKLPGVPEYDGGDRYRTAAVSIKRGPFTLQTNLHTGMAGGEKGYLWAGKGTSEDPQHFDGGDIDEQHHGVLSLGIGPIRLGWDSEGIRHTFQNRLAHDHLWKYNYGSEYAWVRVIGRDPSFFFYIGSSIGNTMW